MVYSNTWKLANLSTVTVDGTTYEDAVSIGIPGSTHELVEITALGASRKEFVASDYADSDEITITGPFLGVAIATGGAAVACSIFLAKPNKTLSFSAIKTKFAPSAVELDGKLAFELTLKPTTVVTVA